MKQGTTPAKPRTTKPIDPINSPNPLTMVVTSHDEELSVLKCLNPQEAIAQEKHLHTLIKTTPKWFMKGLHTEPDNEPLPKVMPALIQKFKRAIGEVCDTGRWANHKEVNKAIEDPEGMCIWDWDPDEQDQGEGEAPADASIQQENLQWPGIDDLIESLDQPLTEKQARMVADLYRSHACMLEWQGQVSMPLGELSTSLDHKSSLTIANTMVKPLHQITLPLAVTTKLTPLAPPRCVPHNEWIFERFH